MNQPRLGGWRVRRDHTAQPRAFAVTVRIAAACRPADDQLQGLWRRSAGVGHAAGVSAGAGDRNTITGLDRADQ